MNRWMNRIIEYKLIIYKMNIIMVSVIIDNRLKNNWMNKWIISDNRIKNNEWIMDNSTLV